MSNQVAYGFMGLQNIFDRRVTEIGVSIVETAIAASVAEHQRQMTALSANFVRPTTDFKTRFRTPALARLQPMDENGRSLPIRPTGQYDLAFPIYRGGIAWGTTYEARLTMTVQEANEATSTMLLADARWMRDHFLAGLFTNVPWTFVDDLHGNLTIQGLANGDSTLYQVIGGADSGQTANNYVAQAAAISDAANPFPNIWHQLTPHPENSGEVIALIPTNLRASIEALATYYPVIDPNLRFGVGETILSQPGDQYQPGGAGGSPLNIDLPGLTIGYESSKVWINEWRSLPDNYIVAFMTGGERPLAMREDVVPQLRGFNRTDEDTDYPRTLTQYMRKAGIGAWNRVGAMVIQIGNANYSIPTGYTSPMS